LRQLLTSCAPAAEAKAAAAMIIASLLSFFMVLLWRDITTAAMLRKIALREQITSQAGVIVP
jgi:hypothetical protein